MKLLANWKVQLAFAAAFVTLFVVGALSYRTIVVSGESDRWVEHTQEVLENLKSLQFEMGSGLGERPRLCLNWEGGLPRTFPHQQIEHTAAPGSHSHFDCG